MKKLTYTLVCILVLVCIASKQNDQITTLNGTWKLEAYHDLKTGLFELKQETEKRTTEIIFSDNSKEGTIHGHTLQNEVFGNYILDGKGGMRVVNIGSSRAGEPQWGSKLIDVIRQTTHYTRTADSLLIYYKPNSRMIFIRM